MIVSRYDGKYFYLTSDDGSKEEQVISCNIRLQGITKGKVCSVKTDISIDEYEVFRFVNPYLNAQNDTFKINLDDKSVGYIFPFASIEEHNDDSEGFDEYKQAYKYYCARSILEKTISYKEQTQDQIRFSEIVKEDSIYIIIHKPQISNVDFRIEDCLPSFALKGYYYYPVQVNPNVLKLQSDMSRDGELYNLIKTRFHSFRSNGSITVKTTRNPINQNTMINLLYTKLLIESSDAVYRFFLLYQIIEILIDKQVRNDIEEVFSNRSVLTNYELVGKINDSNNTGTALNKLFAMVQFTEKDEITQALRSFILEFNPEFKSNSPGDCLYKIRNLLFHDFKSVFEKNKDGILISLVIQCEILIHQLLISSSSNEIVEKV